MNSGNPSHIEILNRLKQRDRTAIKAIYKAYFDDCARVVYKHGGTKEDAREVFQQTMFSLVMKLENENFMIKSNLKGYLMQSCFNIWIKAKQHNRKYMPTEKIPATAQAIDTTKEDLEQIREKEKDYLKLYACLKPLSPECRKLLELSFFKKKTDEEIASSM